MEGERKRKVQEEGKGLATPTNTFSPLDPWLCCLCIVFIKLFMCEITELDA